MKLITACVIAAFAATSTTMAAAAESGNEGYLVDGSGKIVMSGGDKCWHTSSWTPALAVEPCDPVVKPIAAYVPAPIPAPTPAPVAAAPAPAPAPAPVPVAVVAPLPQKISFSGDALFGFDRSSLRPEGMVMLDALVRQLEGATHYDTIIVTGHTDRIGSERYNQQLSERRAATVKDYLVSKEVRAFRIDAQGKGEADPVTLASECRGAKSAAVISCLQPNRRVDIEMTGTKTSLNTQ